MTRKSKARYGMSRTYKLNPAVKALRNALFAGMAMAAVAPGAQAACVEVNNVITCSGEVGFLDFFSFDFSLPFDPTTVILDDTNNINVNGPFGVYAYSANDQTLINYGGITVFNNYGSATGMASISDFGDSTATNHGRIEVYSSNGTATGVSSFSNYGDTSANNTGDIYAYSWSGAAIGMSSNSPYGDASASNDGNIYAESFLGNATGISASSPFGDVYVSNGEEGHIEATTFGGSAWGINAQSFTGDVDVTNDGSISAYSTNLYATGILAQTTYGNVSVDNTGTIEAYANGTTRGIHVSSWQGDVSVYNSGDIDVHSRNGVANGVFLSATYGDISLTSNGGSISAESDYSQAIGVLALGAYGDINIDNSSEISAYSNNFGAYGMFARASNGSATINNDGVIDVDSFNRNATGMYIGAYDVNITGSGDISADTHFGNATGIYARGRFYDSPVTIDISGDISAYTYQGNATGILASSQRGDVYVTSAGVIDVETTNGNAVGIRTRVNGYTSVDNSGNIYADTVNGFAIGIQTDNIDGTYIYNSGDIDAATSNGLVRGIQAQVTGFLSEITIVNSGDIEAHTASGGSAQGIRAVASRGYAYVDNTGNVSTSANGFNALSIVAVGQYGVEVYNGGILDASSNLYAFGIYANSRFGDVYVTSTGDITAESAFRQGMGIYAKAGNNAVIFNYGDITASSDTWSAYGAYAYGQFGVAAIFNEGTISVDAYSDATGLFAKSLYSLAYINNSGDVSVSSDFGIAAYGLYASAFQDSAVILNYGGDISADGGFDADASAIVAVALDNVVVYNSGELNAYSFNGDAIGIVGATEYGYVHIYNNGGNIYAESINGNAYGIYARSTYAGDIIVGSSGAMDVSSENGLAFGIYAKTTDGDISVGNYGDMTINSTNYVGGGIWAITQTGDISILNSGIMYVDSNNFSTGIFANTNYGDIYVANSGDLTVSATGPAVGIETRTKYDIEVFNLGDITATSDSSFAGGIFSQSFFGDVYIASEGNIDASSGNYAAGISAFTTLGDVTVLNSGAITVDAPNFSVGIQANAKYDVFVANSGSITSTAFGGNSTGIDATSDNGDVDVYNFGAMNISSVYGEAVGINASTSNNSYYYGSGNVVVVNTGNMTVYSEYNLAAGILASADYGDVFVGNTGILHVESGYFGDAAVGIYASGKYGVEVVNQGAITALSTDSTAAGIVAISADYTSVYNYAAIVADSYFGIAVGISARGLFDVEVTNTASINAHSEYSLAEGIGAISYIGDVTVTNSGDLMVASDDSNATGILAAAPSKYSSATVINSGAITAIAYGDAYGIHAFTYNGDISITNGTKAITASTTAYLGNANGIYAESNSGDILIASNGAINVIGDYATGIRANTGSYTYYGYYGNYTTNGDIAVSTGTSSNINAYGFYDAYGINAEAAGSVSVTNAGSILATAYGESVFSVGIRTESGYGTTISNSGTIDAAGDNAWAIVTYAEGTTITNSATGKIFGDIWTSANYVETDSLTNDGKWYVGDYNDTFLGGTFFGGGDDSIVNSSTGKIFMDDSYISMGYSEGSTNSFLNNGKLYANNANYIDMGGNGSVFTNNGASIHMEDGDINDSLTIYGDFAGTGHIVVDADGANMIADRLYIEGNVVTNTANVIDVELLSLPSIQAMLDGDTIDIVHVSGTSTAANFNIGIVTPPFDEFYTVESSLIKNINYSGTNDLFSLGFEITGLAEAGILASSVSPAVQNLWTQASGNVFQREGTHREFNQNPDGSAKAAYTSSAGIWARYYGASGSITPEATHSNFGSGGSPNFDQEFSGWEAGVGYAFNSQWSAGLLGGTSESTIDPEAGGRLKLDAETLGAYVMYTPGNGLYFDLSYRGMNFDGNSQGGSDSQFSYSGDARGFSFEMGYGYKTSNGLIIEPQLQYSAVSVEMDTLTYNSADFELKDGDAALLRIGAAIRKSYKTSGGSYWTPYGALSYLDASDSENSYEIGGLLVGDNDTSGGSVLAEAGVTGYVGKWGMSGGVNWRNGGAYDGVFGGQVSVRYDW